MIEYMIYYFNVLLEGAIAYQYYENIGISSKKNFVKILLIWMFYSIHFIVFLNKNEIATLASIVVINYIYLRFIYDINNKNALLHALMVTIMMIVTEFLVVSSLNAVIPEYKIYQLKVPVLLLSCVLSKLVFCLCMQMAVRMYGKQKENDEHTSKIIIILCMVPAVSSIVILTMTIVIVQGNTLGYVEILVAVSAILLIVVNMLVFYIHTYTQKLNAEYMNAQLQLQREHADVEYYQMVVESDDNRNILIHDIRNQLQILGGLLEQKQYEQANQFLEKLNQKPELQHSVRVCENNVLNILLLHYQAFAREKGISFGMDIRDSWLKAMDETDIGALFGNLLDNGMQAAGDSENGFVDLSVTNTQSTCLVTMINSCVREPQKLPNGDFMSWKKDAGLHGYGTKSIRRIAEKYNGSIMLYYDAKEKEFHSVITLVFTEEIKE